MRLLIFVSLLIILPFSAFAVVETITATHKYVMGDNDSKNDARRMCFMEAKRKVLEKAGSYIESNTTVRNYQLAKDEIIAYSAALLKIETIDEKWEIDGSNMAVTLTVKADVDASILEKQLAKIQKDKSVQDKIKQQSAKLQELEQTVNTLRQQLGTAGSTKEPVLRKERNVVFKEIDELEKKKTEIIERVQKRSRNAKKYIVPGMTKNDVESLLGDSDSAGDYLNIKYWIYGNVRIWFTDDVVRKLGNATRMHSNDYFD
jgi:hypothetical protein